MRHKNGRLPGVTERRMLLGQKKSLALRQQPASSGALVPCVHSGRRCAGEERPVDWGRWCTAAQVRHWVGREQVGPRCQRAWEIVHQGVSMPTGKPSAAAITEGHHAAHRGQKQPRGQPPTDSKLSKHGSAEISAKLSSKSHKKRPLPGT